MARVVPRASAAEILGLPILVRDGAEINEREKKEMEEYLSSPEGRVAEERLRRRTNDEFVRLELRSRDR